MLNKKKQNREEVMQSPQGQTGLYILKDDDSRIGKFMKKQYILVCLSKELPVQWHTHSKSNPEQPGVLGNDH